MIDRQPISKLEMITFTAALATPQINVPRTRWSSLNKFVEINPLSLRYAYKCKTLAHNKQYFFTIEQYETMFYYEQGTIRIIFQKK